jgi:putative spermidine/putrescine transport system permease protein
MSGGSAVLATAHPPRALVRKRLVGGWGLLALPGIAFLLVFFVLPIGGMIVRSFTDPSPANYREFLDSAVYRRSLLYTLRVAFTVTVLCVALGFPWAYLMHHARRRLRVVLTALVLIPFWSSLLVRTYAWTALLRPSGVVNYALIRAHLTHSPLSLMGNTIGTTIGMTQILLPFMVLPLFAVMRRIDEDLVPAAKGLGATPSKAFLRVFVPLTLPGLYAGALLVFVLSLGFYITPAVLGSLHSPMFSQVIVDQVTALLRFGFSSALSVILLIVTILLIWLGSRLVRITQAVGYEELEQ